MGLFTPIWMTSKAAKKEKALAAVRKVNNRAKLEQILHEAPIGEVRVVAATQLGDQEALLEIAVHDSVHLARKAAIMQMDEEHLVRFASRQSLMKYNMNNGEEELLALQRIKSGEALADLCLALQIHHYLHPKTGGRFGAAVKERMGEAECAIAARKLISCGDTVDPTGFLGSRILSPELRSELGIDLDKDALIERFQKDPCGSTAKVLWPLLDDGEKMAMQSSAAYYLCDGDMLSTIRFDGLIEYIDDQTLYAKLLMANPNHERNLAKLIERIDDPAVLRKFLTMLEELDVYHYPAITRPPNPSWDNFVIHTFDHHDTRAVTRIKEAAGRRLRYLERRG